MRGGKDSDDPDLVENRSRGYIDRPAQSDTQSHPQHQILKHSGREEHAYLLNLAGLIIVLSWVIPYINDLFSEIMDLVNIGG